MVSWDTSAQVTNDRQAETDRPLPIRQLSSTNHASGGRSSPGASGCGWPAGCRSPARSPTQRATATRRTVVEEHRDLVDLQLVEHPSFERSLRHIRSMHQHVAVRGGGLGLCHRALDPIGHIRHQWIVSDLGDDRWAGRPGSSHRWGWPARRPVRAPCPGRCQETAACPVRRPRGR